MAEWHFVLLFAATVHGFAFYPVDTGVIINGIWTVPTDGPVQLLLYDTSINPATKVALTTEDDCDGEKSKEASIISLQNGTALISIAVSYNNGAAQYFCSENLYEGQELWQAIVGMAPVSTGDTFPLGVEIGLIFILLFLSGLFSGLNLGLMSLDTTELKIVSEVGSEEERGYAKAIMPLRMRGNMLLCTVLLGNVIVNSALTVFLEDVLGSGIYAVIGSSLSIVIIGEIFPQALCARHALWVGAHTLWLMKFFMALTSPVSYPISLLLDRILGEEIGAVYQRKQLLKLIQLTRENMGLGQNEVDIITGALTFREKVTGQIMTKLENVFMLDLNSVLDYRTVTQITQAGHSRIPVYKDTPANVVGLLFVRDLCFVDPDDKTPLEAIINHYHHPVKFVHDDTKLDNLLELFRQGRTHICIVVHLEVNAEGEPLQSTVGIVTLEDVLEEIIQAEILDENDNTDSVKTPLLPFLIASAQSQGVHKLNEQFMSATLTYLATLPLFEPTVITPSVLRMLLKQPGVVREITKATNADDAVLYRLGAETSIFTLILDGRVKVTVGRDQFSFESGPFTTLGLAVLSNPSVPFCCDFSAHVCSDTALIVQISRSLYMRSVRASKQRMLEESKTGGTDDAQPGPAPPTAAEAAGQPATAIEMVQRAPSRDDTAWADAGAHVEAGQMESALDVKAGDAHEALHPEAWEEDEHASLI